jgi:molybdenum cofactor guanylyltransferase
MTSPVAPTTLAIATRDITGLILCGGAGQRMGGIDKGLMDYHGQALVDRAIARLTPQVGTVVISANRHSSTYATRGCPVIGDLDFDQEQPQFNGPLAGILAGLTAIQTEWLMVVPCDSPEFPPDLVQTLTDALHTTAFAPMSPAAGNPTRHIQPALPAAPSFAGAYVQGHPVFALLSKSALPSLESFLASGERKLGLWMASIGALPVTVPNEQAFRNINTPGDLKYPSPGWSGTRRTCP